MRRTAAVAGEVLATHIDIVIQDIRRPRVDAQAPEDSFPSAQSKLPVCS